MPNFSPATVRALRGDRTRAEVARAAEIDYSTLWRWETGKQPPRDVYALLRLATTLGVTLDEFYEDAVA